MLNIVKGKIASPVKGVIYGPEGIGKSTLAADMPKPLFFDFENGSTQMDVDRVPHPDSWSIVMAMMDSLIEDCQGYQTLIFDTADWMEQLIREFVCQKYNVTAIEEVGGWAAGWKTMAEEFKRLLDKITLIQNRHNCHAVFVAHSQIKKFELPEESGAYDQWEMRTDKRIRALLMQWSDMILFINYELMVITNSDKKKKVQGGKRVIHTTHHACWCAKNRYNLASKLDLDYKSIESVFVANTVQQAPPLTTQVPVESPAPTPPTQNTQPVPESLPPQQQETAPITNAKPSYIPDQLWNLMTMHGVSEQDIKEVVAERGHYTVDTPMENYRAGFIENGLIANWDMVIQSINAKKVG